MGFLKTMGYREFHVSVSRHSSFLYSRESSAYTFIIIYIFSLSPFLSFYFLFSHSFSYILPIISFRYIFFLSCVHTYLYLLIDPNRNLRPILCLFSEVPIVRSRTMPRLTSIHLSGQSIPPIKLVEQADLRRSKFWQFAYIFPSTKAKLLSWLSGCLRIYRKYSRV